MKFVFLYETIRALYVVILVYLDLGCIAKCSINRCCGSPVLLVMNYEVHEKLTEGMDES